MIILSFSDKTLVEARENKEVQLIFSHCRANYKQADESKLFNCLWGNNVVYVASDVVKKKVDFVTPLVM